MSTRSRPRRRSRTSPGDLPALAGAVAERRRNLALTQAELAELADVSVSSVRALEAGQATLTLAVALAVLDALGLAVAVGPRPTLSAIADSSVVGLPRRP